MMNNTTIFGLIAGSITIVSSVVIVFTIYLHRKLKRANIWETSGNIQSVTNSAPISRRSSSSCLITMEKQSQPSRSRSASFGEDLTARLQVLTAGSCYRSYSPTTFDRTVRLSRPSLGANIRFPVASASLSPIEPSLPSITFQLRYEHTIETLFITIFQLQNYVPVKTTENVFIILYLLPNDDEQRQTRQSTHGVFNEHFNFPLKSNEILKRTLRFTVYTVDSITRIRHVLGHVFIKFDQFITDNQTFSTKTLSECLIQDIQIRSDYLGEVVLINQYFKDQNLLHIRIQQVNHLRIEQSKLKIPLKAHLSGQTSNTCHKHHWSNSSTFIIPSSSSFRLDQELNLSTSLTNDEHIQCHIRLHLHGLKQIHSHARWQHSLRSVSPQMVTVPLVVL